MKGHLIYVLPNAKDEPSKFKFSLLNSFIPYMKDFRKEAIAASLFMLLLSLFSLPIPYLMKYIVDDVIGKKNFVLLNLIILALVLIHLLKLILSFLTSYFFSILNQEVLLKIKKDLFSKLLRLPLSFFDKTQTGYLLSRIGEVEGLSFFFSNTFVRILIGLFEFIFCLSVLFYLNWKLTLISITVLPLFYFATKYYSKNIRKLSKELMEKSGVLSQKVQDSLSGVEVIKAFTSEERIHKLIFEKLRDKTCIIISHRILRIPGLKIYSMRNGKIRKEKSLFKV